MCARVTLKVDITEFVRNDLGIEPPPGWFRFAENVAPSQRHWIVRGPRNDRKMLLARWGFPSTRHALINIRAETARQRFSMAFATGRCILLTDGFYEWTGPKGKRQPIWFHDQGGKPLYIAAFQTAAPTGPAFALVTRDALGLVRTVHNRMPLIIPATAIEEWLHSDFSKTPEWDETRRLITTPVSTALNRAARAGVYDDPAPDL